MVYSKLEFNPQHENCSGSDWLPSQNGEYFKNPSPIDGVSFTRVPCSSAADVDAAISADDGSSPMCFPLDGFRVGEYNVLLGGIHNCLSYIARDQFELWQNTPLTVDVVPGRGASLSAEIPLGVRIVTESRLYRASAQVDLRRFGTGGTQT